MANPDPYAKCESEECTHDLGRAVLLSELLGGDDPDYTPSLKQVIPAAGAAWMAAAMRAIGPSS